MQPMNTRAVCHALSAMGFVLMAWSVLDWLGYLRFLAWLWDLGIPYAS
jgi:hypothetical protein